MATILETPSDQTRARSPILYLINDESLQAQLLYCDVYIWVGDVTLDKPASPNYVMRKVPNTERNVLFDVGQLVKEQFKQQDVRTLVGANFATAIDEVVWIQCELSGRDEEGTVVGIISQTPAVLSSDGWTRTRKKTNQDWNLLMTSGIDTNGDGSEIFRNVRATADNTLVMAINNTESYLNQTLNFVTDIEAVIPFVKIPTLDQDDSKNNVLYYDISPSNYTGLFDKWYEVRLGVGTLPPPAEPDEVSVIRINVECPSRYEPKTIYFINKMGVWDFLPVRGRTSLQIETTDSRYLRDGLSIAGDTITYEDWRGQKARYNVQGTEKITVNTGWVDQDITETIQELLLSEEAYILENEEPLIIDTSSLRYKTDIFDRTINYTFEFTVANPVVNTTR